MTAYVFEALRSDTEIVSKDCPECGGQMQFGECPDCGHTEGSDEEGGELDGASGIGDGDDDIE